MGDGYPTRQDRDKDKREQRHDKTIQYNVGPRSIQKQRRRHAYEGEMKVLPSSWMADTQEEDRPCPTSKLGLTLALGLGLGNTNTNTRDQDQEQDTRTRARPTP